MIARSRGEDLIRNEGDFFKCLRYPQVPGVDNLSQIGPGIVANFPKLASSAAHLFGKPKVWEESGGSSGVQGKFVVDYHLARGVTSLQLRIGGLGGGGGAAVGPAPASPQTSSIAWYVNRAAYLLSMGRPAAQVALFHPTNSMWLGDEESDNVTVKLTQQLIERQIDFDYIDEQSLSSVATLEGGGFKNLSGQVYRGIIIPSSTVITRASLERLRAFAGQGGKVVFVGRTPAQVIEKTFMKPGGAPDLSFAVLEPTPEITARVVQALPKPDVVLDSSCPPITYNHRSLRDAEVYFLFNESNQKQSRTATLAGSGQAQVWDAAAGVIRPTSSASAEGGSMKLPLVLEPYEAKIIVLGPLPAGVGEAEPSLAAGQTVLELSGDWSVTMGDKQLTTPLRSWEDLGVASYSGAALYKKEFTSPAVKGRVFVECDDVREYARVKLNGVDLDARGWRPYRWEVTKALRAGANLLEVEVRGAGGGGRAPAPPPTGATAAPGRGGAPNTAAAGGRGGSAAPVVSGLLPSVRLVAR
jgi:hypothetical protein